MLIALNWLRDHAYLAAWLGPVVAITVAIFQNRNKGFAEVDWSRLLIYFAFLVALAVVFTPTFDQTARDVARFIVFGGLGFLITDRRPR
jgi:hypothetical protein